MKRRGTIIAAAVAALAVLAPASAGAGQTRYSLVHGCYAVRGADGSATGPLRLQAAGLGAYLLYTPDGRYMTTSGDSIAPAAAPTVASIYRVTEAGAGRMRLRTDGGRTLDMDGTPQPAHDVGVVGSSLTRSDGARVTFVGADGCATFPESEVDATGTPARGSSPTAAVKGLMDSHTHMMAFDFLGGELHCGRPWSPLGITVALPDCASIQGPKGTVAPVQNFLDYGDPEHPHDTVGWPTFNEWPTHEKLSYEQSYYRWVERAWRGGLRVLVNNLVENEALCTLMPRKSPKTDCNDMSAVRRQRHELFALQDYVDAQSGGPGKGWFRIVTSPWQARQVVNDGKLAVVMGIEVSRVLGCGIVNGISQCNPQQVKERVDNVRSMGISSFFPVHKFDNAFGGTQMDGGTLGPLVNVGNKYETGQFWDIQTCTGSDHDSDQLTSLPSGVAPLLPAQLLGALPGGMTPVYPATPHCNTRGLTPLGADLLRDMAATHTIVEIDHMDARTGTAALSVLEGLGYSGVVSSHDWEHPSDDARILKLGGVVSPYPKSSVGYSNQVKRLRGLSDKRFQFGVGYGEDMNGLGDQAEPRNGAGGAGPVQYPFKAAVGDVELSRLTTGSQTWDVNADGAANYGLMPDLWEDMRLVGGQDVRDAMVNGAESYLEMWERAYGVPAPRCQPSGARVSRHGIGDVRLGASATSVLRRAGQPRSRPGRSLRWCGGGVRAVFGRGARAERVVTVVRSGRGAARVKVPRSARSMRGLRHVRVVRARGGARIAYVGSGRRVRTVAVAARSARSARGLRSALRAAGVHVRRVS